MSQIILYISMSSDGYIAKPNDDLSFLSIVEKEGEDCGFECFISMVVMALRSSVKVRWLKLLIYN